MSEMPLDTSSPLAQDDFSLFRLPKAFSVDVQDLDRRWKEMQKQVHPDKFSMAGASAQRVAMQWSSRINEAYRRLKTPLTRASYLCELLGAPIQAENNTAMPEAFLMEQMTLRESLEDAQTVEDFERLESLVQGAIAQRQSQCSLWAQQRTAPNGSSRGPCMDVLGSIFTRHSKAYGANERGEPLTA